MSSTQPTSIHADPGPIDETLDVECAHSGSTFPTDPPAQYTQPCEQDAVFRVEVPNLWGTAAFCPFHLARWDDAFPDRAAVYSDHFGSEFSSAQPGRVWLTGRDLPSRTNGGGSEWRRLGLDQRGHARFFREAEGGHRLLTFAPGWNVEDLRRIRGDLRDCLDFVSDTVGWVDLDPEIVDRVQGGEDLE